MALKSGLAAQLGVKAETTWGTFVAPTRFYPLISESLTEEIDRLESEGIIPGARVLRSEQWAAGNVDVGGSIETELYQQGMGALLKACFGAVSTSGAGPYTHTFTPGDLTDDHLSVQVGKPDVAGTVQPFSFYGMKVTDWELSMEAGGLVTLSTSLIGKQLATSDSLATASFGTGTATPFTFKHASATVAGGAANVKKLTIQGSNGLDGDRRFIGSAYRAEPLEAELREYSGTVDLEFESLTQYNRYRDASEVALVATISAGAAASLTTTMNVRFDGSTPEVDGRGIVQLSAPYKCIGTSTDASAITAVLINADTTPV